MPEPEAQYEPLAYRADGQDYEIPGSLVGEGGVFIPDAQVPEVQQLLSAGRAAFGSVRQRLSEAAESTARERAGREAAEAQAQHILGHFETLIEKSQGAQTLEELIKTPLGQWLLGVTQGWPILKAEAKAKAVEVASKQAQTELARYREQEQQAQLRPLMEQTLRQTVWMIGRAQGLDDGTLEQVYRTLSAPEARDLLFVRAPYDDPQWGRKGDLVINNGVVAQAISLAGINRTAPQQQQKIEAAQRANAAAAGASQKAPPTVGARGRTAVPSRAPAFKTAKEADDFLLNGDLESLVEE